MFSHDLQRTEHVAWAKLHVAWAKLHVAWAKLETLVMGKDNP